MCSKARCSRASPCLCGTSSLSSLTYEVGGFVVQLPSVWIQELTWQEVREYLAQDDIAIVPIGSTEQHGPAGTLGTDTFVAIGLAEDAAKKAGVLVAPPIWYGESSHHMALPTISVRAETLLA